MLPTRLRRRSTTPATWLLTAAAPARSASAARTRPIRASSPSPPSSTTGARTSASRAPRTLPKSPKPLPDFHFDGEDYPMKKFVNDPANFVPEFMKGIALANRDLLDFNAEFQMITRRGSAPANAYLLAFSARFLLITRKGGAAAGIVSIVQGLGWGHEPVHVMAVGPGMLTGACQAAVFAAPPVGAGYETVKKCAAEAGV